MTRIVSDIINEIFCCDLFHEMMRFGNVSLIEQ